MGQSKQLLFFKLLQETFQNSTMGKKWEIFPSLGKRWNKKILFREKFGNSHFPRFVKWVFMGNNFTLFYFPILGKTGVSFPMLFPVL